MKKIFIMVISMIMMLGITGCNKDSVEKSSEISDKTESSITGKDQMKVVNDKNKALKSIEITENEKEKLVDLFLKNEFEIYVSDEIDLPIPYETRITEIHDMYDECYSIYNYKNEKYFAVLSREKPCASRSAYKLNKMIYTNLFLIPMDKVYNIEDFKDIEINKSDLSDVKKIYKYADILFEQELQAEDSKKKCSIYIMSDDSGITISFKKKGNKYIVTEIENNADGSFVSMIADVDKSFD